jgi:hypothetical protein
MKTIPLEKFHELLGKVYAVCVNDTLYYVGYDDSDKPFVADNHGDDYVSLAEVDGDIEVLEYGFFFHVAEKPITLKLLSLMTDHEMLD